MNQGISILLVTTIPIILFIWLLYKRKWKFWLDDKGLHLQPLFWFLITLPLIISAILWLLVSEDYSLNLTKDGYNQFIEYAKLPLLILTLSPILGAFVINAHRSIQTAKQIEVTEKKNKVDIYYVKRKYIHEQLAKIKTSNQEYIDSPILLIINSFTSPKEHIDNINEEFLNKIKELVYKHNTSDFFIESMIKYNFITHDNLNHDLTFIFNLRLIIIDEWLYNIKKLLNLDIKNPSILIEKYNKTKDKIENIRTEGQISSKDIDDHEPPEWCINICETHIEFIKFYIYQLEDIYLTVNAITSTLWSDIENNSDFMVFQSKLNELIKEIRECKYKYIECWVPS
ncbi:hypothetical protein PFP02_005875 [Proteus mirabilis]|nr:hypothetical protein [Proteus mirabilis]